MGMPCKLLVFKRVVSPVPKGEAYPYYLIRCDFPLLPNGVASHNMLLEYPHGLFMAHSESELELIYNW